MANTAQARKRARQALKRRAENMSLRSRLRSAVKSVRKAIAAGNRAAAEAEYRAAQSVMDGIAGKGIVHKNRVARNKSSLVAAIKKLPEAAPAA
ncbi:MAG: 30S ribosomal protein S20 [Rhodocyclaceae bacterium]|nr:30S ribosomal protein S20 [Rhodocyclaceae bacterium]MBX3669403.1 30S ribosomal protein S20 [Rhodocyclaceae bacterium]